MSPKLRIDNEDVEIIEEDHEDALKKVINPTLSWKKVFKVIFILVIAGIMIYYIIKGGFPSDVFVYALFFICIIGAAFLISLGDEDDDITLTISVLNCLNCNVQKTNRFVDGDSVFQMKGKCQNCDGDLQITEIYSVKLAKELKKKKL
ncbi:MAG: hypothetical protein ACTSVZ_06220 [Promethearchaeota archaeon]